MIIFKCAFITIACITLCLANIKCKSNRIGVQYSSVDRFSRDMCAQCYRFMDLRTLKEDFAVKLVYTIWNGTGVLCDHPKSNITSKQCYFVSIDTISNKSDFGSQKALNSFKSEFHSKLFASCCEAAKQCCERQLQSATEEYHDNWLYCPAKWDGWSCWQRTPAGTTATQLCADFSYQSHRRLPENCLRGLSEKKCESNGSWYIENGFESTNYMQCSFIAKQEKSQAMYLKIVMQSISLAFLVVSVCIFIYYKQYRIVRIKVHLNFFLSFILTSITTIILNRYIFWDHFYGESIVIRNNSPLCISVYLVYKFARLTNYFWMLCEGIYLHKLIVAAFHEQTNTIHFYLIGWLLPMLFMIPYCVVNSMWNNKNCWTNSIEAYEWIYNVVPVICLTVNTVLLLNAVRVLFTKLRSSPNHSKVALKATFVLIPIFGLQFTLYNVNPLLTEKCGSFSHFLLHLGTAVDSLHGALVSTLFCFLNTEVHSMVKRSLRRRFKSVEVVTEEHEIGKF